MGGHLPNLFKNPSAIQHRIHQLPPPPSIDLANQTDHCYQQTHVHYQIFIVDIEKIDQDCQ